LHYPIPTDGSWLGSGLTQKLTLPPGSIVVTPIPTASPGSPLKSAAIIGLAIAATVLVIFTTVIIVLVAIMIKCSHSKQTAGELFKSHDAISVKENEAYGTNTQTQHITTAANEAYGCVGDIPVAVNILHMPGQSKAYSGAAANTDIEEQVNVDEIYDYVNL